jgi:hypothetical protein
VGGERVNGKGGGQIWQMYFAYVSENRTMKPVEIALRSGEWGLWENDKRNESN